MPLMLRAGKLLVRDGRLAVDPRCCCVGVCSYAVRVGIDWGNRADLDLYAQFDGHLPVYYGNPSANGLSLNRDAHPLCSLSPSPPEEITGEFEDGHTFHFWFDQYSGCEVETPPASQWIEIENTGEVPICVNGETIEPSDTWTSTTLAYAGYATGSSPGFTGGTEVVVACGDCED